MTQSLDPNSTSEFIPEEPPEPPPDNGGIQPPFSREAEEAVLGAVLINPEVYYDLAQFLLAEDFYIHRHRWIWEAFSRLYRNHNPLDFLTVIEELQSAGKLTEAGSPAYLTALINRCPPPCMPWPMAGR